MFPIFQHGTSVPRCKRRKTLNSRKVKYPTVERLEPRIALSVSDGGGNTEVSSNTESTIYYVASDGHDTNPGSIDAPFKSIQHAASLVTPGDIVKIRGGTYRERIQINSLEGTVDAPIIFQNYNDEQVTLSGAQTITTGWAPHEGHIWKTDVTFDVTQLFLNEKMLTAARWPNITKDWDQLDDGNSFNPTPQSYWDPNSFAQIDGDNSTAGSYTNLESRHPLSELGVSIDGAVLVPHTTSPGTVFEVSGHTSGQSTFSLNSETTGNFQYYLTSHLGLLDQPREWHYDKNSGELYVWMENNADPNNSTFEARGFSPAATNPDYRLDNQILTINDSAFLQFDGFTFHTGSVQLWDTSDTTFSNSKFLYSVHNTHMLGDSAYYNRDTIYQSSVNQWGNHAGGGSDSGNLTWRNCEFAYSYNAFLHHGFGNSNVEVDNCYFHNKPTGGGVIVSTHTKRGNIIRRVTAHSIGYGGIGKVGNTERQGALVELMHLYDYHFHGDDSGIQVNTGNTAGMVLRYNWIHDMEGRNAIRFDGDPGGFRGTVHHNVLIRNKRGTRLKGDQHTVLNNLALANTDVDINVSQDKFYGYDPVDARSAQDVNEVYDARLSWSPGETVGNFYSIVHNNVGDNNFFAENSDPANQTANSSRWNRGSSAVEEVRDFQNFDFRPREGSALIDAGTHLAGYTDGYVGDAPDIGPYEFGDTHYWIPGYQSDKARTPIPSHGSVRAKRNTDLIWLEGLDVATNKIYLGTDAETMALVGEQPARQNIFDPGVLEPGQYYWKIDTVRDDGSVREGDVWTFTVPSALDSPIYIPTVYVGQEGNPADSTLESPIGQVDYGYYISKYEITNTQYASFLNSIYSSGQLPVGSVVDGTGLYHPDMATLGGIARSGESGNYSYSAIEGKENHPVNFVSYWDALRFCNWVTTGTTSETGIYNGIVVWPSGNIRSNEAWESGGVAIANENEWYKAAYYSGSENEAGDQGSYWTYATQSNDLPERLVDATYGWERDTDDQPAATLTDVGTHDSQPSFFGTYDQTGNVRELIEPPPPPPGTSPSSNVNYRGGSIELRKTVNLQKSKSIVLKRHSENLIGGFRVVSKFPIGTEPENAAPTWIATSWTLGAMKVGDDLSLSVAHQVYDPENESLSFSLLSGPDWLTLTSDGVFQGTPTVEHLGNDSVLIRVADPHGLSSDTELPVNLYVFESPSMDPVADQLVYKDASTQTVPLQGITAAAASRPIRVTATSSLPELIPNPTITYSSANPTGTLAFTPVANQSGTATITVTVEDGGQDTNLNTPADNATMQQTFQLLVLEVLSDTGSNTLAKDSLDNLYVDKQPIIYQSQTVPQYFFEHLVIGVQSTEVENALLLKPIANQDNQPTHRLLTDETWRINGIFNSLQNVSSTVLDLSGREVSDTLNIAAVSGAYEVNSVNNPTLIVRRGQTYTLKLNVAGHPFYLQTTGSGYQSANIYSSGFIGNGQTSGEHQWVVPEDAPDEIYYQCEFHPVMFGKIIVID